jgi:hypothetical protein
MRDKTVHCSKSTVGARAVNTGTGIGAFNKSMPSIAVGASLAPSCSGALQEPVAKRMRLKRPL